MGDQLLVGPRRTAAQTNKLTVRYERMVATPGALLLQAVARLVKLADQARSSVKAGAASIGA